MPRTSIRRLVEGALIAALYAALTLALPALSFGPWQCRVSEALTILPIFTPAAIPGLTIGCIISNAAGLAMGMNPAGALDIPLGSTATLLAALCTYALRNVRVKGIPVLSAVPPVIFNMLIVGAELSVVFHIPFWLAAFVEVGIGEAAACLVLGLGLASILIKTGVDRRIFAPAHMRR